MYLVQQAYICYSRSETTLNGGGGYTAFEVKEFSNRRLAGQKIEGKQVEPRLSKGWPCRRGYSDWAQSQPRPNIREILEKWPTKWESQQFRISFWIRKFPALKRWGSGSDKPNSATTRAKKPP
jgi:hypothetical protein